MSTQAISDVIALLPDHKVCMSITHNQHKVYYQPLSQYLDSDDVSDFESEEMRQWCLDTDEIWEMQWYPCTPVSFHCIAAPTLESLLTYAQRVSEERHATR